MKRISRTFGRVSRSLSNAIGCEWLERRRLMATVSGTMWLDINNNNVVDGSDTLCGGPTAYIDLNNNGSLNAGEPSHSSSPGFSFQNVPTGTYNVRETGTGSFFSTNVVSVSLPSSDSTASVSLFNVSTVYPLGSQDASDAYTLRRNAGGTKFELAKSGGTTYTLPLNVPPIQVFGGPLNDSLTVDYVNGNPIPAGAGVTFNGGTFTDTLIVNGTSAADTFDLNIGTVGNGGFVNYTATETLTLNTLAGNDTVNVFGDSVPTTINGGNDNDTFNVGLGELDSTSAAMTINGDGGDDTTTVDDSHWPWDHTYTITGTTVTRPAFGGVTYGTTERLDVLGASGNSVFNIESTASGVYTVVADQFGDDTFNVTPTGQNLTSMQGLLTISAAGGTDVVNVNDSLAPGSTNFTYTVANNNISRETFGGLSLVGVGVINLTGASSSDSTYNITSNTRALHINDAGGNNAFNVGAGNLDSLTGPVYIVAGAGNDTVNVQDSNDSFPDTYTITPTALVRDYFGGLTFQNADALVVYGGIGNNTYNVTTGSFVPVYLADQGGTDTINVNETSFGGAVIIYPGGGDDAVNVNADNTGSAYAIFAFDQRIGALTIGSGGYAQLYSGLGMTLTATSLSIAGTGVLDLSDGAAIVDYTGKAPLDSVWNSLISGYNGGAWNGSGIISSAAQFTPGTAVGFALATDIFGSFPATFAGQSIDGSSILMRYTLYGDADLNKSVDTVDFNLLAANFAETQRRWSMGDFDFNTTTDTVDFNLLASKFGNTLPAAGDGLVVAFHPPVSENSTLFSDRAIDGDADLLEQLEDRWPS